MTEIDVQRAKAHQALDELFDQVADWREASHDDGGYSAAYFHFRLFLGQIGGALGDDFIETIYGEDDLFSASNRMALLSSLLSGFFEDERGETDRYSPAAIRRELEALANGDAPILFAKRGGQSGRRDVTYRLALAEARAFYWDAWLKEIGVKPAERQAEICLAFGKTWDAFRKNRKALDRDLGEQHMAELEAKGARLARLVLTGMEASEIRVSLAPYLKSDGQAYQNTLRLKREVHD